MNADGPHGAFRRELRERALEAALIRLNASGWSSVRMADIATDVGVSRPTLYAEFGKKEGLGAALVTSEADRFLDGVIRILQSGEYDPVTAVDRATEYAISLAASSAIVTALLASDASGDADTSLLQSLSPSTRVIGPEMYGELLSWFAERCPATDRTKLNYAVDALLRLVVSYIVSPGRESADEAAAAITRIAVMLLPELASDQHPRTGTGLKH